MKAILCVNTWAGRLEYTVEIVGETPKYYRVKLMTESRLPGRNRYGQAGDVVLVKKFAVRLIEQEAA